MKTCTKTHILRILSLLILLAGCERELLIEQPHTPLLALEGYWRVDETPELVVSNTISIYEPAENARFLHEAVVNVWKDDLLLGQMVLDTGQFGSARNRFTLPGVLPEAGHSYRVEASAAGFPSAVAETNVPEIPKIAGIRFIRRDTLEFGTVNTPDYFQQANNILEFDIQDLPNRENFYQISNIVTSSTEDGRLVRSSRSPEILDSHLIDEAGLIPDRPFANGTITIRVSVVSHLWTDEAIFLVTLLNAPDEWVQIKRGSQFAQDFENPFIEPYAQFSNVVGGVGTLLCFPTQQDSISVPL